MKKFLFFAYIFSLVSCISPTHIPIIFAEEIFNQNKDKYYVLIYLNGCLACRDVKLRISKMNEELISCFYYIDLELNPILLSDETRSNVNCMHYLDIKIKKTPTLFVIEKNMIIEEYIKSNKIFEFFDRIEDRNQR